MNPVRSTVEGIVWPPLLAGEAAQLAALLTQLELSEYASAAAIEDGQYRQLAPLLAHHARHSGHFARRLAAAGLTAEKAATPGGFALLGLLTRRDLQTAPDLDAREVPKAHGRIHETHSSGSTGEPVHCRRTALNQLDWLGVTMRDHRWHRRDLSGRFCAIRAYQAEVSEREDWGPPATLLHRTGPALLIPTQVPIERQAELIARFRPTSLLLYPSNLAGLLRHIDGTGQQLDSLRDIRTFGETVPDALRTETHRLLGLAIADNYSTQEAGYVALQCPVSGLYHVMAENLIVEILDEADRPCAPGKSGRVVLTDLRNFATPLIRYDIGDMAERGGACPCGRGLPTIARVRGRVRNLLTYPDGRRAWPMLNSDHFRRIAGVAQFQFIQRTCEAIDVRLILDAPLTPGREAEMTHWIQAALGNPFALRFLVEAGPLATGPSGKFEEFVGLPEG